MNAWRWKTRFSVCGISLLGLLAIAEARGQATPAKIPPEGTPATATKLAEEEYKNIQALKGIPAEQVIPSMQFIAASLGVECEYCHVAHAFEKDDKKAKVTARKMIGMMMAINKENFDGHREVTCYSCHRGSADPVAIPIITAEEPKREPPEAKPDKPGAVFPPADQLLDKYVNAIGGADALKRVTSRVQKGTLTAFGGQHFPVEVYSKAPNKRLSVMHLSNGDSVTGFDGEQGWLSVPGRIHRMSAAENAAAHIDADLSFPLHVKTLCEKFQVDPGEEINGHDTYLVTGRSGSQPLLRLYFDRESGLLLRLVRYAETPLGHNPTQIDYGDYREANRLKVPFRWTLSRPGTQFTIQMEHLEQNVPVDDAKFVAPTPSDGQKPPAH